MSIILQLARDYVQANTIMTATMRNSLAEIDRYRELLRDFEEDYIYEKYAEEQSYEYQINHDYFYTDDENENTTRYFYFFKIGKIL